MTESVNGDEAKTRLSRLIARTESGEEITLARHGPPEARLVPLKLKRANRVPGSARGKIVIADDFDEFTDQDAADWYGE